MNEVDNCEKSVFEKIKHIDEYGNEYWDARELMLALGYSSWREFKKVIKKAAYPCKFNGINEKDNFSRFIDFYDAENYKLSRYACYMIAENGEPNKTVVAEAQNYIIFQTGKCEMLQKMDSTEIATRIFVSSLADEKAKKLNATPEETKQIYKEIDKEIRSTFKSIDTKK